MSDQVLFKKFKILRLIKKDDVSAVYHAQHIFLSKPIFLKTLNTRRLPDVSILKRFKREAKILARLEHPNIIKVLDFGTFENFFYISFEYFESQNLRYWLKTANLTTAQKEQIIVQLMRGLQFAHQQGIVHRDLKPENILINDELQLKIADFGLALLENDGQNTEATALIGTPAYMSPEQIRGALLTRHSDYFNLGIIVFELYTGENPFLGRDVAQTINNILNFEFEQIKPAVEKLPQNVQKLLKGLLQRDAQNRFSDLQQAFEVFNATESLQQETAQSKRTSRPNPRLVLIGLIAITFLLTLIFWPREQKRTFVFKADSTVRRSQDSLKIAEQKVKRESIATNNIFPKKEVKSVTRPVEKEQVTPGSTSVLMVDCFPWAHITVDSTLQLTTPLKQPLTLSTGRHHLLFEHPAFSAVERVVHLAPGETTLVKVNFDSLTGYLWCAVHPWGKIYLNGNYLDETPLREPFRLKTGAYDLRIENPAFLPFKKQVHIAAGETLRIKVNFEQTDSLKRARF